MGAGAALALVACTAAGGSGAAASSGAGTSASSGCGSGNCGGGNQNADLQNIGSHYPDYYQLLMNVDGQPTIGILCFGGVAIMTTSRDQSAAAAQPLPGLDAFCKTQIGSKFSRTGQAADEPRYANASAP
jgi:hypothetical protein